MQAIYRFHADYAGSKIWWSDAEQDWSQAYLEGGDLMPAGNGTVLLGMGERTSRAGHHPARAGPVCGWGRGADCGQAMGYKRLRLVETARDYSASERQQWDSANNAVALEPGVVLTYDRNTQTNAALRNAGEVSSAAAAAAGTA